MLKDLLGDVKNKKITSKELIKYLTEVDDFYSLLNKLDPHKWTLFSLICQNQPFETIKFIFDHSLKSEDYKNKFIKCLNFVDIDGWMPMHFITRSQSEECIKFVLNHELMDKKLLLIKTKKGTTPLKTIISRVSFEYVKVLMVEFFGEEEVNKLFKDN